MKNFTFEIIQRIRNRHVASADAILCRCARSFGGAFQNQFEKLEGAGVHYSRLVGNTRLYAFSPRYPFLEELKRLLEKALDFYPESERQRLVMERRRPRRKGKPL